MKTRNPINDFPTYVFRGWAVDSDGLLGLFADEIAVFKAKLAEEANKSYAEGFIAGLMQGEFLIDRQVHIQEGDD